MSTSLVRHTTTAPTALDAPMSFSDMMKLGDGLARTGFLPDHIKNGAQAAAIILAGRELGMAPMRSLRSIAMVKGKITESADSQLARFKTDGGRAKFTSLDESTAVLWLRHPNGDEHTESFTIDDAKKAGLLSSGMYSKFPKAMLRSRAITAGLKSIGWEGGAGAYDPDELDPSPASHDEPPAVHDAAPLATEPQRAFLAKISKSSVFTDSERARLLAVTTKEQAQRALDWAKEQVSTREPIEAADVGDVDDSDDAAMEMSAA